MSFASRMEIKKANYLEMCNQGPTQRSQVFRELFLTECTYRGVTDFISEFIAKVFPPSFIEGKNKKVFNRKLFQFVKFNRFEMFTWITILERFKIDDISWLKFNTKSENAKYFSNENKFVLWRVLKWLFEEVITSLLRCFFYCTEK